MAYLRFPARFIVSAVCAAVLALAGSAAAGPAPAFPAGSYAGLIQGDSLADSGTMRVTIDGMGRGSLVLQLGFGPMRLAVAGSVAGDIVPASNHPAFDVVLAPVTTGANPSLTGTFNTGAGFRAVTLENVSPAVAASVAAAGDLAGIYTLVFKSKSPAAGAAALAPVAGLMGIGTLEISAEGRVRFFGANATGTLFTQAGYLDGAGGWMLHAVALTGETLSGEISFADAADSDCSGAVQWQAPATSLSAEVDTGLQLLGSRYVASLGWDLGASPVLDASSDGGKTVDFTANPKVMGDVLSPSSAQPMAHFDLNRASGIVFGNYFQAGPNITAGVVFQKTQSVFGLGWFLGAVSVPPLGPSPLVASSSVALRLPSTGQEGGIWREVGGILGQPNSTERVIYVVESAAP